MKIKYPISRHFLHYLDKEKKLALSDIAHRFAEKLSLPLCSSLSDYDVYDKSLIIFVSIISLSSIS